MIKKLLLSLIGFSGVMLLLASNGLAIPTLQLEIEGGWYDQATETIMSSGASFTLYAFLAADSKCDLSDTYYISAALIPPSVSNGGDFGSFVFAEKSMSGKIDLDYGTPPLANQGKLPDHGIFPNYYKEYSFKFSETNSVYQYNTQTDRWPAPGNGEKTMYFQSFHVDTAGLNRGYRIHFDLYNTGLNKQKELAITDFSPFSHDAESTTQVPEPGTLFFLGFGLGLLGVAGFYRSKK